MRFAALAGLASLILAGACAKPEYPAGAVPHGPYLDRSFEGFVVRAFFETDITVLTVQPAGAAPEPTPAQISEARLILWSGVVIGPDRLSSIAVEASRFEAAAKMAAGVPGWCRSETRFSFLPPVATPLEYRFEMRASYYSDIGGFVFAGQCR